MDKYKNFLEVMEYVNSILEGRKVACIETIQACQRFVDDLNSGKYDFKAESAEFIISIIEKTFVHVKGPLKNKPLKLDDWEKFCVYNLVGFYIKGTDERRFKEAFIFIPRKNGKTTFIAALTWALSLLERKFGSTIYIVGNVLKQALESFSIIRRNIRIMGEDAEFRILDNNSEHSISRDFYNEDDEEVGSIKIEALASNPDNQDGYNCNIAICDEIHAYKNSNQYFVIRQAMKAYINKLLIGITTAGENMNSFCYQRLQYCQKVLLKEYKDEQCFVFICKADDPTDYTNPIEHEKANPNYKRTVRAEDLIAEALQAQNDVTARNQFLNKSLNIYTNTLNTYFNIYEVQASDEKYNWTIEELSKLKIDWYGGADLSKQHDLTAACLYGRYGDTDITIAHGFIPRTQAQKKADEDDIPFFWWEEEGWLTMCNDEVVDYEDVVKWFLEMKRIGFKIKLVGFDKYNSRDFVASMQKHKFRMINQDQAYWKKSEAFREIERRIKKKNYYYLHNKAYEYCISNVKAVEDSEDRIKFSKISDTQRIDLFDASVVACKQLIEMKEKSSKAAEFFSKG
jgi:phage terminase large subunit-like protein